ncbi:MAG: pyrroline-5-carboxylate reductase [Gammaproteobacteria bacterium]|nr:pyrroline-5-carboxylate reductase [Gammaproteobacteria bacterium]
MAAKKKTKRRQPTARSKQSTARNVARRPVRQQRPLVGFLGAGNMARSLAGGLIANGWPSQRVILSDPNAEQRATVATLFRVKTYATNADIAGRAQILVIAVKPQVLQAVAREIADVAQKQRPLVISIAAGVRADDIQRWLGGGLPIVRAMPNTPALVGSGATGLYANDRVDASMRAQAESILRAVGVTSWLNDEESLDVVTALSGSGPAYFFLVMEALERAAIDEGLDPATARLLTLETAFGAAKIALEDAEPPATLRARVTSPGGTTERALTVLREGGLERLFQEAIRAAAHRARELADLFGKEL